jgi:hypothetical protein
MRLRLVASDSDLENSDQREALQPFVSSLALFVARSRLERPCHGMAGERARFALQSQTLCG